MPPFGRPPETVSMSSSRNSAVSTWASASWLAGFVFFSLMVSSLRAYALAHQENRLSDGAATKSAYHDGDCLGTAVASFGLSTAALSVAEMCVFSVGDWERSRGESVEPSRRRDDPEDRPERPNV